jgi:hypothetical protein
MFGYMEGYISPNVVFNAVEDSHRYANVNSCPNSNFDLSSAKCLDPIFSASEISDDV